MINSAVVVFLELPQFQMDLYSLVDKLIFQLTYFNLLGSSSNKEENIKEATAFHEKLTNFAEHSAFLFSGIPIQFIPHAEKSRKESVDFLKTLDFSRRLNVSDVVLDFAKLDPSKGKC